MCLMSCYIHSFSSQSREPWSLIDSLLCLGVLNKLVCTSSIILMQLALSRVLWMDPGFCILSIVCEEWWRVAVIDKGRVLLTISPKSHRYVTNSLFNCSCCRLFITVSTKSFFVHCLSETADDPDAFVSGDQGYQGRCHHQCWCCHRSQSSGEKSNHFAL